MSLESWKKEFYPTYADTCKKKDAIKHSLRKWEGLMANNLKKHGVICKNGCVEDDYNFFSFDAGNCSLCRWYYRTGGTYENRCNSCPLFKTLGYKCDREIGWSDNRKDGPYTKFSSTGNPWPMIRALRKTLERYGS